MQVDQDAYLRTKLKDTLVGLWHPIAIVGTYSHPTALMKSKYGVLDQPLASQSFRMATFRNIVLFDSSPKRRVSIAQHVNINRAQLYKQRHVGYPHHGEQFVLIVEYEEYGKGRGGLKLAKDGGVYKMPDRPKEFVYLYRDLKQFMYRGPLD